MTNHKPPRNGKWVDYKIWNLDARHQMIAGYGRVRDRKEQSRIFPPMQQAKLYRALDRIRVEYHREFEIFNPHATGVKDNKKGAWQWIDAMVILENTIFAIDLRDANNTVIDRKSRKEKEKFLKEKEINYLQFTRPTTSIGYEAHIRRYIRGIRTTNK